MGSDHRDIRENDRSKEPHRREDNIVDNDDAPTYARHTGATHGTGQAIAESDLRARTDLRGSASRSDMPGALSSIFALCARRKGLVGIL